MKEFENLVFDPVICERELRDLKTLLNHKPTLNEKREILPFFRKRRHLSVFVGSYFPYIVNFDRIAYEYSIFGDFSCDLAVGDSQSRTYCFIEFENADPSSIFRKIKNKATLEWSPRFEHGFSQIVDWFWKLDDMRQTTEFKSQFGGDDVRYYGLLVLGRSLNMRDREKMRLKWRLEKVIINSMPIFSVTFDELCHDIGMRLQFYSHL